MTQNDNFSNQDEEAEQRCPWKSVLIFIASQWLIIGIGLVCLLAYLYPGVAKTGGEIRAQYSINYGAVGLIFLISGLSIPTEKLKVHLLHIRLHLLVQGISFVLVPAVMVGLMWCVLLGDKGHNIDRQVIAGYIFTSCLPTTIASNVAMTRAAGGEDSAAIVEVLIANLLGPFITPSWTMVLLPRTADFDGFRSHNFSLSSVYTLVFKSLGLSVLLPLAVGQVIKWIFPRQTAVLITKLCAPKIATACLLLIIWMTFSNAFATGVLETMSTSCIIFILLFNIAIYLAFTVMSFLLSRPPIRSGSGLPWVRALLDQLPPEETVAVCFCAPAKSTALGMPLLAAMWAFVDEASQAKAAIVVLFYTVEQIFVANFIVFIMRGWLGRIEKVKMAGVTDISL